MFASGRSTRHLLDAVRDAGAEPVGVVAFLVLLGDEFTSFLNHEDLPGYGFLQATWSPVAADRFAQCADDEALLPGFEFN